MVNRIEELEKIIAKAQAELEALRVGGKRWRANKDEEYWAINDLGEIGSLPDYHDKYDDSRYSVGNYFQTKEEAQHALKRMIATQQLKDRIAELNVQQGWVASFEGLLQGNWIPFFNARNGVIESKELFYFLQTPIELYGSKETIETVIKEMPEQIKLCLGVE